MPFSSPFCVVDHAVTAVAHHRCFAAALTKYQTRSLIVLYDTIGTFADNAGGLLAQPDLLAVLMPPLMQRWNQVRRRTRIGRTREDICISYIQVGIEPSACLLNLGFVMPPSLPGEANTRERERGMRIRNCFLFGSAVLERCVVPYVHAVDILVFF